MTDQPIPVQPIEAQAAAAAAPPWPPPGVAPFTAAMPEPLPPEAPLAKRWATGYASSAHELLSQHHGIHGELDVLGRRLGDLLGAHAALISHVVEHAPPVVPPPGTDSFWDDVVDRMKTDQGVIRLMEQGTEDLLLKHAGVIRALETLL